MTFARLALAPALMLGIVAVACATPVTATDTLQVSDAGHFFLHGSTASTQAALAAPRSPVEAARDFMSGQGAAGLGLSVGRDTREVGARTDRHGVAHVTWQRVVAGIPLDQSEATVHVEADGRIRAFSGVMPPLSEEMQACITAAATGPLIDEGRARLEVSRDLLLHGRRLGGAPLASVEFSSCSLRLLAIPAEPWVVWDADAILANGAGRWQVRLDARTGHVISRRDRRETATGPPHITSASIVNFTPTADLDNDGRPEAFSFDVAVDADYTSPSDSGSLSFIVYCTTTQQFWSSTAWQVTGTAVDPHVLSFTQADFGPALTANSTLDFRVELWDSTPITFFDAKESLPGEPFSADVMPAGPKVGTGIGVTGATRSHVDSRFDATDAGVFRLRDETRRIDQDVHGHRGELAPGNTITTWLDETGLPYVAFDRDNAWDDPSVASAVDAHVNAALVYDYLLHELGCNGYDGHGASFTNYADVIECTDNAAWIGDSVIYCISDSYPSFAGALDVAAHEWAHGVTNLAPIPRRGDLAYRGESGALNEAFSDWFGAAVEQARALVDGGSVNWTMGESVLAIRDLSNPPAFGQPDDYLTDPLWFDLSGCVPADDNDQCGVHQNSGVPNRMFHLLAAGGARNGVTVSGLGTAQAIRIAFDANIDYWPEAATFADARDGMVAAAASYGANAQSQVANAWAAVGVGEPVTGNATGDIAPRANPNGAVDVADVVQELRFAVRLDTPTPAELQSGDIAPITLVAPGPPRVVRPAPDGVINVADVVEMLRVAVSLDTFG